MNRNICVKLSLSCIIGAVLCGCSTTPKPVAAVVAAPVLPPEAPVLAPGVEETIWEQPMVDVIQAPPGIDPEGIYYRPAHQQVVEIRQGRWKYHRAPQEQ